MGSTKQINIKHQTYYFYNDVIDIETFDENLLKIDKKRTKTLISLILDMSQKNIDDCININSVNPHYLRIKIVNGYIEKNGLSKYLVFDSADENKELLKKYSDVFNRILSKIREIDDDWLEYAKDYIKVKFSSDDDLPLNKFLLMTITIRRVFKEDKELYPQVFLDDTLYEL